MAAREFIAEQRYFLSHHRLHNRLLHGWGVVCGLGVTPHPDPACPAGWWSGPGSRWTATAASWSCERALRSGQPCRPVLRSTGGHAGPPSLRHLLRGGGRARPARRRRLRLRPPRREANRVREARPARGASARRPRPGVLGRPRRGRKALPDDCERRAARRWRRLPPSGLALYAATLVPLAPVTVAGDGKARSTPGPRLLPDRRPETHPDPPDELAPRRHGLARPARGRPAPPDHFHREIATAESIAPASTPRPWWSSTPARATTWSTCPTTLLATPAGGRGRHAVYDIDPGFLSPPPRRPDRQHHLRHPPGRLRPRLPRPRRRRRPPRRPAPVGQRAARREFRSWFRIERPGADTGAKEATS